MRPIRLGRGAGAGSARAVPAEKETVTSSANATPEAKKRRMNHLQANVSIVDAPDAGEPSILRRLRRTASSFHADPQARDLQHQQYRQAAGGPAGVAGG